MKSFRTQSAMEYLMTYGWAILIIAVVLGALYQLGIFNPSTFQAKAQPGNCQVLRPNGPNTTQFITLQGVCNGQQPQFVAKFSGVNSYVSTGPGILPTGSNPRSVFGWVYWTGGGISGPITFLPIFAYGISGSTSKLSELGIYSTSGYLYFAGWANDFQSTLTVTPNSWNFVGYTYSGSTMTIYLNGNSQTNTLNAGTLNTVLPNSDPSDIGKVPQPIGNQGYFVGSVTNVQMYNASLSSNGVQALYLSGIGGAPIRLQNLVGWWPLNGNPNDYSGNLNNGVSSNIVYSGTWTR